MTATGTAPDRRRMAGLLKEAGSALDPDGVAGLIAGILAAPPEADTSWHALVADPTPPALAESLETMRAYLAEDYRDGLGKEDFARLPRAARLALLREELKARHLDGFIVPRADEHQGEYVPACGQRLAWLTGFTGSAGLAIVLSERAALFVDGRYTLQAAAQVDGGLFEMCHLIDEPPARWLAGALAKGAVVGYDPWLHTPQEVARLQSGAGRAGASLKPVANPIDRIWPGRPPAPLAPVVPHPERFAGESSPAKRTRLGRALAEEGVAAAVLTAPESIAWLLNIRGGDVPHTPLPLSFAILRGDGSVTLFIDRRKLAPGSTAISATRSRSRGPNGWGPRSKCSPPPASGSRSTRRPPHRGSSTGSTRPAPISIAPPTRACCRKPARTPPNSTAPAPRIAATALPSAASWPGWRTRRHRANCARSPPATGSKRCAGSARTSAI